MSTAADALLLSFVGVEGFEPHNFTLDLHVDRRTSLNFVDTPVNQLVLANRSD